MSRPSVLVTRKLPGAVEARLADAYDAEFNTDDHARDAGEIVAHGAGKDAILCTIGDPMDASTISRLPQSVRILATFSAGVNHIDLAAAAGRGMTVTNTPDALTEAAADIAMLLILGAARRASEGERLLRSGQWSGWAPTQMLGAHLHGRTLGIVGMGRIGRALAVRARASGMRIHYTSPRPLAPDLAHGAVFHGDLIDLLRVSDVVSLHAPSTPATRKLLNAETLALLPRGAVVVNTARGDLVDDDALIGALRSGHIAAAGLDVFDGEPRVHPGYLDLPNTFLLPHLGSATVETRTAMGMCAADNLDAFFSGRPLPNLVMT